MWIQDEFNNYSIQSHHQHTDFPKSSPKTEDKKKYRHKIKHKQMNLTPLEQNQTLISQAFRYQCQQKYVDSIGLLEKASQNLVGLINRLQGSSDFIMKAVPIMREERQVIKDKIIDTFWNENQSLLNKDYQQNTYYMLLMRELEQKNDQTRWKPEQEQLLHQLCSRGQKIDVILSKLSHKSAKQVTGRVYRWQRRL